MIELLVKDRRFVVYAAGVIVSLYLWKKVFTIYKTTNQSLKKLQLFQARHNCVVMYSRGYLRGWPPNIQGIPININNIKSLLEPFLYFINMAQETLDIAMMIMRIPIITDALISAKERGVKVRLIINYESVQQYLQQFVTMKKSGIQIQFYIAKTEQLDTIMHYKYMIKDYQKGGGFVCMGSANLASTSTFVNNFEDVIFSSNHSLVAQFRTNFDKCWRTIGADNEEMFNKSVLREANLL